MLTTTPQLVSFIFIFNEHAPEINKYTALAISTGYLLAANHPWWSSVLVQWACQKTRLTQFRAHSNCQPLDYEVPTQPSPFMYNIFVLKIPNTLE